MSLVLLNGLNWVGSLFPGGFALYCFDFVGSKTLFFVTGDLNHWSPSIFIIGIYRKVHVRSGYIACCLFTELTSRCH